MSETAKLNTAPRDDFYYGTPVEEQPRRDSKIVVALLAIQTMVLVSLLCGGVYAYRQVMDKAEKIDAVVTIVENPSQLINQPQLVQSLVGLMQNTTGAFFFGSEDGAIPSFINNLMLFDFGAWGNAIATFASDVTNTFQVNTNSSLCDQWISCQPNSNVQCADGSIQWCNWDGTVNCAPVSTCVGSSIVTGASLVGSIAQRIGEMQPVTGATDGTPAFSDGVFRLDLLMNWVRSQMSSSKWQNAGYTCESFVKQVRAISWNGTYYNTNDQVQSWDASSQVSQAANYVEQVCNGLQQLESQQHPQQGAKTSVKGQAKDKVAAAHHNAKQVPHKAHRNGNKARHAKP